MEHFKWKGKGKHRKLLLTFLGKINCVSLKEFALSVQLKRQINILESYEILKEGIHFTH